MVRRETFWTEHANRATLAVVAAIFIAIACKGCSAPASTATITGAMSAAGSTTTTTTLRLGGDHAKPEPDYRGPRPVGVPLVDPTALGATADGR
jgi:hypothetical protein